MTSLQEKKITGTDNSYRLFVIESPKKIAMLSKILRDLGEHFVIVATHGRLYDIEPIEPYEFVRTGRVKWSPVSEERISSILDHLGKADDVVVATDSDIEGEVIAWHLQRLAEVAGTHIRRVHVKSVNEDGIRYALEHPGDVDIPKAEGGVARRIFDNFSQFAMDGYRTKEKPFLKGSVGRVITPLIASCASDQLYPSIIKKKLNGSDFDVIARVPAGIDPASIEDKMKALPRPYAQNKREETYELQPLNLSDAVQMIAPALKRTPSETFGDLKNLFDKGKVSYFRTDSRRVSPQAFSAMSAKINDYASLNRKDIEHPFENDQVQDAHEALIPLEANSNPFSPIGDMPVEEATLALLWRYYSMVLSGSSVSKASYELGCFAAESSGWSRLKNMGVELELSRMTVETGSGNKKTWDPVFQPIGIGAWSRSDNHVLRRDFSGEELTFNRLVSMGVGRPSTISMHSAKYGSRFLSKGKLNGRGYAALEEAKSIIPGLIEPGVGRQVESRLHEPDLSKSITDKVVEALDLSGWIRKPTKSLGLIKEEKRSFSQSFEI